MDERYKRSGVTNILMHSPGVSDDGYDCTAKLYGRCVDERQRLLCPFGTELEQGSNVWACKDDRVTRTIASIRQGMGDVVVRLELRDRWWTHESRSASLMSSSTCLSSKRCINL